MHDHLFSCQNHCRTFVFSSFPCGKLRWLSVSFSVHAIHMIANHIVSYRIRAYDLSAINNRGHKLIVASVVLKRKVF